MDGPDINPWKTWKENSRVLAGFAVPCSVYRIEMRRTKKAGDKKSRPTYRLIIGNKVTIENEPIGAIKTHIRKTLARKNGGRRFFDKQKRTIKRIRRGKGDKARPRNQ